MFVLMGRVLIFILLSSQFTYGQLTSKEQQRFDSLYAYAQNPDFEKENRLKTYAKAAQVVYKDLDYGIEIADSYRKYAEKINSPNHLVNALDRLGYALMVNGNTSLSRMYTDEMLRIAIETNNPKLTCRSYASLGNLKQQQGDLDSALFFQKKSLDLTKEHGFKIFESRALLNIGTIEKELGHYRKSLESLMAAKEIIEKQKAIGYYTSIYNELGDLYTLINEYTSARTYYDKALKTAISKNNHWKRVETLGKIADLLLLQDSVTTAKKHLVNGLNISYEQNISLGKSTVLLGLAKISFAEGEHRACVDTLNKAISLMINNNLQQGIEEHYLWLGKGLIELGLQEKGMNALQKAYDLCLDLNEDQVLRETCFQLYRAYKNQGNALLSLKYLEEFNELESIYNDEQVMKELLSYELKDKFENKLFKDSVLNAQEMNRINTEHIEENRRSRVRLLWTLFVLAILTTLFIVVYRNYRSKKKQSELLQDKNEEIEGAFRDIKMLHKELQHRVKNNMQIASSLLKQRARHLNDDAAKKALNESSLRLQSMLLAYQKLHSAKNLETIDLLSYIKELMSELSNALLPENGSYEISGESIDVNIEQAQTTGFIIHELVSNSCKYAWPHNDNPFIKINLSINNGSVGLNYCDNGIGLPDDISLQTAESFGHKLIYSLVTRQLPGTLQTWNDNGACFSFQFKSR
jgi:two-component sensor histidine kinase